MRRYRRIWWRTVLLTLAVALMPLVVMTGVNYYLFRRGLQSEIRHQTAQDLSNISRSVEAVIEERVAALRLLSREKDLAGLSAAEVETGFVNLRDSFGGFVDLGLIDRSGSQVFYTGPYNLKGHNYLNEDWFHQVHLRDVYVSDVFMGHRQLPHFVVVVKQRDHLLRATVDMQLLNRHVFIPASGPLDDVFLVNDTGILQTSSRFHGRILSFCSLPVPPYSANDEIVEGVDALGTPYSLGYSYIRNTPFILMVVRKPANPLREWLAQSPELVLFLCTSSILILIVVLWSLTATVRHIRAADLQRDHMLRGIEHTSKMATVGRLAASVAHEINNPLAIINEKAGLLKDLATATRDFPHQEKLLKSLDGIIRSVQRCGAVTHRLLGFTRRLKLRQERIELRTLITDVLGFLEKEAMHRSIQIDTEFGAGLPEITSDRGQLEEVILNILNNAFAAVEDGGKIRVSVHVASAEVVQLEIEDNGCGISKENIRQIFEPFFSTKGEFGTGLGLCITYDLVQKLGGKIEVESRLGEWTRFSMKLPLDVEKPLE